MPGARPRARINVDAIRRDAGVRPEHQSAPKRPRSAAPNLRMVLLSGATRLPLDEYLTYVCGVLFGLAFAAFAGILLQLYFEWLEWLQNEWFQISGAAFAVPVAAPHHLNFVQVISVAVGIVLASLRVGLVRCARLALRAGGNQSSDTTSSRRSLFRFLARLYFFCVAKDILYLEIALS